MDKDELLRKRWAALLRGERVELEIELNSGGRGLVMTLTSDGTVRARRFGGPLWTMGSVMNSEVETLDVWQGVTPPDLHQRFCEALVEAGFPVASAHEMFNLVPDEHPSVITVLHPSGDRRSMSIVYRFLKEHPELARCEAELEHIGYQLSSGEPRGTVPNPELDLWTQEAREHAPPKPPPRDEDSEQGTN